MPGLWPRLTFISSDGSINGLIDEDLVGKLEDVGIPRHQHAIVHLLQTWQQARVPPDVALALWLLRDQEDGNGRIYRRADVPVEESSPAIRYIALATEVGETCESDPTLRRVVAWLIDRQLPDGSIPLTVAAGRGETGQTARTMRALHALGDPAFGERIAAIDSYLRSTARKQETGVAWGYSPDAPTVVTGSTSLAVTALIEHRGIDSLTREGLLYLLAAQESNGGWAEVPGNRSTIQNTFQVVRAIRTAHRVGNMSTPESLAALDRASVWLRGAVGRKPPKTLLEHSFALRAANQLNMLQEQRFERLARQLTERRRQFLDPATDLYADTALAAIALIEVSRSVDAMSNHESFERWRWRWRLPSPTPPFLVSGPYFYELLYGAIKARWWVGLVDEVVRRKVIDRAAGLLLGAITSIGIVSDYIVNALGANGALRGIPTVIVIGLLMLTWFGIKVAARSSVWEALTSSATSLLVAGTLVLVLDLQEPLFPAFVSLVGLRWLVIDVVAFTADSTGLIDRLLPKR